MGVGNNAGNGKSLVTEGVGELNTNFFKELFVHLKVRKIFTGSGVIPRD